MTAFDEWFNKTFGDDKAAPPLNGFQRGAIKAARADKRPRPERIESLVRCGIPRDVAERAL